MHITLRAALRAVVIVVLFLLLLVILVPVLMRETARPFVYKAPEDAPQTTAALVLGASVVHGKPSPVLEERTDAAIALYMMKKVSKILVTGDNGALSHDEVTPVRKYLIDAGVKPQDIFLDHAGFDTYSSMYRARDVFRADSITVVTQDFHMPRAIYVAHQLGLRAYGVIPKQGQGDVYDYIREIPASVKALYDLITGREPKYLGDPFPLTGDGQKTWY